MLSVRWSVVRLRPCLDIDSGRAMEFCWIPAHHKIKRNEAAVYAAKAGTGRLLKRDKRGRTKETDKGMLAPKGTNTLTQKTPVQTTLAKLAASEWDTMWSQDIHGSELQKLAQKPSCTILQLHYKLLKGLISVLIQIRTGKSVLENISMVGRSMKSAHLLANTVKFSNQSWK